MDLLWPRGCDSIEDVPNDLYSAIGHATMINNWHANVKEEDIPPRWMWPFNDEINDWFDKVKEQQSNPNNSHPGADHNDGMAQNEYTAHLR